MKYAKICAAAAVVVWLTGLTLPLQARSPVACDRQLVMQIDSAKISVEPDGVSIEAFGVSESAGWGMPALVLAGPSVNGTATVDFNACRPEISAQVLTPIQAGQTLKIDLATTRSVIIRTKTNSMKVDISQ